MISVQLQALQSRENSHLVMRLIKVSKALTHYQLWTSTTSNRLRSSPDFSRPKSQRIKTSWNYPMASVVFSRMREKTGRLFYPSVVMVAIEEVINPKISLGNLSERYQFKVSVFRDSLSRLTLHLLTTFDYTFHMIGHP
jgi:hypothetical protein